MNYLVLTELQWLYLKSVNIKQYLALENEAVLQIYEIIAFSVQNVDFRRRKQRIVRMSKL